MYQKMREKIPQLLILIYWARINAENRYEEKNDPKNIFYGGWHEIKWRHPRIFKIFAKFSKSNSQGTEPKSLYLQNRYKSLNKFQLFELEKSPTQKSYSDFKSRNSTYLCRQNKKTSDLFWLFQFWINLQKRKCDSASLFLFDNESKFVLWSNDSFKCTLSLPNRN